MPSSELTLNMIIHLKKIWPSDSFFLFLICRYVVVVIYEVYAQGAISSHVKKMKLVLLMLCVFY
jgi:hypothetical protein